MQQIARELGADYMLTATVQWEKAGGVSRVKVAPELVDLASDRAPTARWGQEFDASMTGLFQVQADIAGARMVLAGAPKTVEPAALAAYIATYADLYWVLDDAGQRLPLTLRDAGAGGADEGRRRSGAGDGCPEPAPVSGRPAGAGAVDQRADGAGRAAGGGKDEAGTEAGAPPAAQAPPASGAQGAGGDVRPAA